MHPELFTIPVLGIQIKTYGFFLTVGFLSAVWFAMRRASRVKADPDRVLDVAFLALVFGVGGARLFYVVHYWQTDFATQANKFLAVVDIRQGGLEFLGGLLGAMAATFVYLAAKKLSIRLYLDILAPGAMWGLAFGRIGCFFNGCCFGGLCVSSPTAAAPPWAVRFPFGSPAQVREWEDRQLAVPAELINTQSFEAVLLPASTLNASVEQRQGPDREVERAERALAAAKAGGGKEEDLKRLTARRDAAVRERDRVHRKLFLNALKLAQSFPSRQDSSRPTSVSELQDLAAQSRSLPVHATQLYSSINALLLSGLLSAIFYVRKRHGVVIGMLLLLYPISRVLLELIRTDNPHDVGGLTISQFVSVTMFVLGLLYFWVLYRRFPERSPRAVAAMPPVKDTNAG